ncbi:uncharacterized protein LOC114368886 [Glycine soja]|nr:uncharacterized protein LOC114368886 [Glycine soja]KHN45621.1 hypothetical protein glysoja_031492 [Glycine soja]RZB92800.1 hypothetical protein D0Y65_024651 [Glycine soja]
MSYKVGITDCEMQLWRRMENGDIKALLLLLHSESTCYKLDPNNHVSVLDFRLDVTTVDGKDDLLFVDSKATYRNNKLCFQLTKSIYGDGSVTQTSVFLYGMGHKAGLVVLQRHYNGSAQDENPCAVTLTHYHATSPGINDYSKSKADFGLSVIARIVPSKGNVVIDVEGPKQHPSSALFYLFDQVRSTGVWNPSMCPHCAAQDPRPRSRDSVVPVARPHARLFANEGRFAGTGNGGKIRCRNFNVY